MKIRTIIVDDVKLARERIKLLLKDEEIEIIAECKNGREAIEAIRNLKPDLVILDIQMPKIDGFEVVETIGPENMPTVIFATAYDEFALRAFEVNAIDYLLKPFDEDRLAKALARVKREFNKEKPSNDIEEKLRKLLKEVRTEEQYLRRIPVKSSGGTILIQTVEIDWIGASGNYLELHVGKKIYLIRESLSKIEQELDPKIFVRVHRSTIVNLDRIKSLHPLFNGDHLIILYNGRELNLSRTYHKRLLSQLLK